MKISILITTYNGEKYLKEQLDSIRLQTLEPDEVIIIDDKSTDNTVGFILSYITEYNLNKWSIKVNEINSGWKRNFMEGSSHCNGEYIFFCDQDDIWNENKVKLMSSVMDGNMKVDVLVSNYLEIDESNNPVKVSKESGINDDTGLLENIPFSLANYYPKRMGCTFCVRKEFLDTVRKYWHFNSAHDAFSWRVASLRGGLYILKKQLMQYRQHSGGASKKKLTYNQFVESLKYQVFVCDILRKYVISELNSNLDLLKRISLLSLYFDGRYKIFCNLHFIDMFIRIHFIKYPNFRARLSDLVKIMKFRFLK